MAGYANRLITIQFPELAEGDDKIYVTIRNPKRVPPSELRGRDVAMDAAGNPLDSEDAELAGYEVIAKLIVGWHVYDATSLEDDQPLLGLPATPESVAKLPLEIVNRIGETLGNAVSPDRSAGQPDSSVTANGLVAAGPPLGR